MTDFKSFNLPEALVSALERLDITTPTPIQAEAIPLALAGDDVLGSAQTGTGKTLAYLIPICVNLLQSSEKRALVMTPTRELAIQVRDMAMKILSKKPQFEAALLIGGDPMGKQLGQLRHHPQLIIGTPGRINDHLNRGSLDLRSTELLVLDETDRMLDMGFSEQLETIIEVMPTERQTLMFSATMPDNITRIAKRYLKNPKRITIGSTTQPVTHIKQDVIFTSHSEKFAHLLRELNEREGSVIVFVKTKISCEDLKERLCDEQHSADAIHGDLQQRKRERVVKAFRANKSRIMVATDIAARGLDVPHIRHVINYDLPQCPEDYIHRIGRTGRAGAEGSALCLLAPDDRHKWRAISQLMNPGEPVDFPKGMKPEGRSEGGRGRGGFGGRSGGGGFGGRSSGGGFGGRPRSGGSEGRGFGGDRPRGEGRGEGRSFGSGEGRSFGGDRKPSGEGRGFGGDRPRTPSGEGRSFGGDRDRKPSGEGRSFGGDRDRKPSGEGRSFGGDRKPSGEGRGFGGDRPRTPSGEGRSFGGDRRPSGEGRSFGGDRDRKPSGEGRSFGGDRKPSGEGRSFGGDRKPSGEGRSFGGDRKPSGEGRSFGGDRKPSGEGRGFSGDRDRKPSGEGRSFGGDRKPSGEGRSFGGGAFTPKPKSGFDARKAFSHSN
ncbi:MAG: DEAD/DEAH box helicase [Candidatus Paracaedibacteraceae bacterium]|nr:DEAD/DEAH box helicase [Candidatus Paracaedibacteraceae bacterium]